MDKFEFEINKETKFTHSSKLSSEARSQQEAISFSVSVTEALHEKRKNYNYNKEQKISLSHLKEVYRKAARQFNQDLNPNHNRGCWAMARVNMFTRILEAEKSLTPKKALDHALEVPQEWTPSSEDFFAAQADVVKYNLNYNFKDIEELYLEDYQPIDFEWK